MNRQAMDVDARYERASATPQTDGRDRRPGQAGKGDRIQRDEVHDTSLRGTQEWFARVVMTPDDSPAYATDDEIAQRVTASARLGAAERLDIYRRGYHARLIECLTDDYPALAYALGDEAFDALCRAYIARHPSRGPNLNFFGLPMEQFCRTEGRDLLPQPVFAADLASLERAVLEVIHAASSEPLTLDGLQGMPPEAWPSARLQVNTAVRILRFAYPVNAYFQAWREGASPELPAEEPSATVVYRSGPTVWRMDLTPPMLEVLGALVAGEPLGEALGRAEAGLAGVDPAEVAQRVTHWFREWVSSGLFSGVTAQIVAG
jgi:hypothetical protein